MLLPKTYQTRFKIRTFGQKIFGSEGGGEGPMAEMFSVFNFLSSEEFGLIPSHTELDGIKQTNLKTDFSYDESFRF